MFRQAIIAAASVLALSTGALAAGAASAQDAPSMTINTKGLDLASPTDAKVFYEHLKSAAGQVCSGGQSYFMPSDQDRYDACVKATTADAVASVHAPLVTALFDNVSAQTQVASK